ncbi:hypothetical protein FQR65_LT19578 [Abscondita terminalis]|nr:hypothetical protein FQR65_LT19578 [Abscondita terminalis]
MKNGKVYTFVKFHWETSSLVCIRCVDEAQKISGFNPISSSGFMGNNRKGKLSRHMGSWVQLIPEEDEHKYSFDLLDPTKIVPEELVPVKIIGTMTLNRNPENFFAETEQAAFHPGPDGVSKASVDKMKKALEKQGAEAVLIATRVGKLTYQEGGEEQIQHSYLTEASVCYDAFYTPDGDSVKALMQEPDYTHFINKDTVIAKALISFCKGAEELARIIYRKDAGVIFVNLPDQALQKTLLKFMKQHRIWERENQRKVIIITGNIRKQHCYDYQQSVFPLPSFISIIRQ